MGDLYFSYVARSTCWIDMCSPACYYCDWFYGNTGSELETKPWLCESRMFVYDWQQHTPKPRTQETQDIVDEIAH